MEESSRESARVLALEVHAERDAICCGEADPFDDPRELIRVLFDRLFGRIT
jgi:hypothetical protein